MPNFERSTAVVCFAVTFILTSLNANAVVIPFAGKIDVVNENTGGIYSLTPDDTFFVGSIDDGTMGGNVGFGNITDGSTPTSFSCCTMAAGGLSISNDQMVDQDFAILVNGLLGDNVLSDGDIIDIVDLEGDATTPSGGRIEVGLSWLLSASAFPDEDIGNYPFDPADVILNVFFIVEQDDSMDTIYDAFGVVTPIPLPAAAWLFPAGLVAGLGWMRRRNAG